MLTIAKRFQFHAAHHLPYHKGKCKNVHGHTYELEVEVCKSPGAFSTGPVEETGMIIDFGELKKIVNYEVVDRFDHQNLNKFFDNPTAEVMVSDIWLNLGKALKDRDIELVTLRLWETDTSYARRTRED